MMDINDSIAIWRNECWGYNLHVSSQNNEIYMISYNFKLLLLGFLLRIWSNWNMVIRDAKRLHILFHITMIANNHRNFSIQITSLPLPE
ncbi:hypothetical protein D3C77_596730 [compost metagenome]